MCKAAEKALKVAGMTIEDIDMIIVATVTPDYPVQSTACLVQYKMGARNVASFDVNAACSGFYIFSYNSRINDKKWNIQKCFGYWCRSSFKNP